MIALIEIAFLYYWCNTFSTSANDGATYRQRVKVTAAMIVFLILAGHSASKDLFAVLSGWAVAIEVVCFVLAFLDYDERLFPRRTA
jgi:hypothetical protein